MSLYAPQGGANREIKKWFAKKDGVNREIKSLWAQKNGVNRKVFSSGISYTTTTVMHDCRSNSAKALSVSNDDQYAMIFACQASGTKMDGPTGIMTYQFDAPITLTKMYWEAQVIVPVNGNDVTENGESDFAMSVDGKTISSYSLDDRSSDTAYCSSCSSLQLMFMICPSSFNPSVTLLARAKVYIRMPNGKEILLNNSGELDI